MNYKVEYRLINSNEVIIKEFNDIISAMNFQAQIVKKYRNKLDYCIYK